MTATSGASAQRSAGTSSAEWPALLHAFDGESRQRVLAALLEVRTASVPDISERSKLSVATVTRQVAALEAIGVVVSDMPRGVRAGRVVNFRVDPAVYERCVELWDSRLRVHFR